MKFSQAATIARKATVFILLVEAQKNAQGQYVPVNSSGTGFFVSDDGWLLTCFHVVQTFVPGKHKILAVYKENETVIDTKDASQIDFEFKGFDLCAIKFDSLPKGASPISVSLTIPDQGANLGIFGYPGSWIEYDDKNLIKLCPLKPRVGKCVLTRNEIGDFFNWIVQKRLLETQFSFVKGNSGGPIFSADSGKLVGIVNGFSPIYQTVYECAVEHSNSTHHVTGNIYSIPVTLPPDCYWKPAFYVYAVIYSYGLACDEIITCLKKVGVPFKV